MFAGRRKGKRRRGRGVGGSRNCCTWSAPLTRATGVAPLAGADSARPEFGKKHLISKQSRRTSSGERIFFQSASGVLLSSFWLPEAIRVEWRKGAAGLNWLMLRAANRERDFRVDERTDIVLRTARPE